MAVKFFCDKCGDEVPSREDLGIAEYPQVNPYASEIPEDRRRKELCLRCLISLGQFLMPSFKKAEG